MPTVRKEGPYRFSSYLDRGEPPHIHVRRDHLVAKFWLNPVVLVRTGGFTAAELARVNRMIDNRRAEFMEKWNEFFKAD
jgi:hypothetical protein